MAKIYSLFPILFMALVSCANPQGGNRDNYNLDMEMPGSNGMPEGWIARNPRDSTISADSLLKLCHTDIEVKQHGGSSVLIDRTGSAGWTIIKTVINKSFGGQRIKLTGYLRTEDVKGGAGLWLRIDGVDKPLEFENMVKRAVTGTTDWKEYTIELNYDGKNAQSIVAGAQIMGTGKLWIDNLHITIDDVDISLAPSYESWSRSSVGYNLDLEELDSETGFPAGWGLDDIDKAVIPKDSTVNAFHVDKDVKQHGQYSLLIDWKSTYGTWTASNYAIKRNFAGSRIKLTGYLKTEGVTTGAGLWMRIDGKVRSRPLAFDNMQDRFVKGTTDWQEYTIELEYDAARAGQITVGGIIEGEGKMWMDNLHITIDDKDIAIAPLYEKIMTKAESDTQFSKASGIETIAVNSTTVRNLTNLGMLWGFLKYYHANVCKGDFNMDAELFRVLPKVMAAKSKSEADDIFNKWVDLFGKPDVCSKCEAFKKTKNTKLAPDYGYLFDKGNLPVSLTDKLNYIKQNRHQADQSYYIKMADGIGNPIFQNENGYDASALPDAGTRLLSLYRYWNMIQYFFPDRHLIGEDWNKVLVEFVPEFCNAKDTLAYQLACLKLIARIHDTHANVWGGGSKIQEMKGQFVAPFQANFIEDKLVVTGYYSDSDVVKPIIKIGDIIERINNKPVEELVTKYLPMTAASNYETQLRDLPGMYGFLLRTNDKTMQLGINRNGQRSGVTVQAGSGGRATRISKDGYHMLNADIGYIYPGLLQADDLDKIKVAFANTKGIIIDMRCYPNDFMTFTYGEWLKPTSSPFVRFTMGSTDLPGMFKYGVLLPNGGGTEEHYKGKVVIIVNAVSQSSAEYQAIALQSAPNVTTLGSTTAGADGNVSEITLPGGIVTMISGIGILYPDGTETQRKGVRIDKVVKPTIQGVRQGRDELLEEAVRIIKNRK